MRVTRGMAMWYNLSMRTKTKAEISAINRRNCLVQWEGHVKGEHKWATIRVHAEVREALCKELVRIGGSTRRGVAKPGQINWSVFLMGLLKDAKKARGTHDGKGKCGM